MEQINRESKVDWGVGEHQVSAEEGRSEHSFGIAVMAYVLAEPWSISQLRPAFR
jgi:hypothetical protein